jgi:signal transduction histidine kinase
VEIVDYKLLFESVPGHYLVLKPDFTIVAASDAYLKATMTHREGILGRGLFEVFPDNPDDPNATGEKNLGASLRRVLQTGKPDTMPTQKYDIRRPEDEGGGYEERYWSPLNSPVLDESGDVRYIIHRVEDITDFMRLKNVLRERGLESDEFRHRLAQNELEVFRRSQELADAHHTSQAAISELQAFCFSLSHDFRAPIRAIHSFNEIVIADYRDKLGPTGTTLLKRSIASAQRMDRLIQDVLAFAGLSQQKLSLEPVEVETLVREILSERPEFQPPAATISIESPLYSLIGHEASLTQCITNLLANAIKFVTPGIHPRIRIYAEDHGLTARIIFQDNGIGIDTYNQKRVFGLFERGAGSDEVHGNGIGLAIVRKAVDRMGGKVGVESEPGAGSRFWIELRKANQ